MSQNLRSNKSSKTPENMKELLQIAAKPLIFILALIMVCSFLAHYLTDSETLDEYARNHTAQSPGPQDSTDNPAATDSPSVSDTSEGSLTYNIPDDNISEDAPVKEITDTDNASEQTSFTASDKENTDMAANINRSTYQPGFYYEPLSDSIRQKITGISYPESDCTVAYEDLNYVGLLYIDFNGEEQVGELICNKAIAQDMVEIFYELYRNQYQIERIRLIDEYGGDDTLSMEDNNTSCFNYRVVDGTTSLSKHALGCAIDINPFYNPYVVFNKDGSGETYISPKGSEIYADRSQDFPYKIDENDLCYKLFTEHGFTWGGHWNSCKDYQHFQIVL